MLINFLKNMENNYFNLPKARRVYEILNRIKNSNNIYEKICLMQGLSTTEISDSNLCNILINEINTTQDNDYKYRITNYVLDRHILRTGHEEQLYNHSIELINDENYTNRINKASLLTSLLYEPVIIQNHEDELCDLLQQFHDEIVNTNYLVCHLSSIYIYNIDFFINHRQYIKDLYNEYQQIEERERRERERREREIEERERIERERIEREIIERERRASFYNENKPLTAFMQEIVSPAYISLENFKALPLEELTSKVDNAYVALRKDKDNIELQNNLANARNEFLQALMRLNDEDKECLLAGIYLDLNKPVIFIMETNNKKHNINEELQEKTGITVENLEEIFKQKQQDIETEKNQQNKKGEQNNNLEENFIETEQFQPQTQELHYKNNINIVQEENNIQEETDETAQLEEKKYIQEEINEIIKKFEKSNNQKLYMDFDDKMQSNQKKHGRCSCM